MSRDWSAYSHSSMAAMLEDREAQLEMLREAFIDVLDGNSEPWDIEYNTGLPNERCQEISDLYKRLVKR